MSELTLPDTGVCGGAGLFARALTRQIVLGKWLAAWGFCILALTLTFPLWITVNLLGSLAIGAVFGFSRSLFSTPRLSAPTTACADAYAGRRAHPRDRQL